MTDETLMPPTAQPAEPVAHVADTNAPTVTPNAQDAKSVVPVRQITTPDEYLWTASTAQGGKVRAACLAVLTNTETAIIEGPACWYTRTMRADVLEGLAPSAKLTGTLTPEAAATFLNETEAENAARAAKRAAEAQADAEAEAQAEAAASMLAPPPAADLTPIDPDTLDASGGEPMPAVYFS